MFMKEIFHLRCLSFPSIPAICTQLTLVNSNRSNHIIQTMVTKGCKVKFFPDFIKHLLVFRALRVCINGKIRILVIPLQLLDHPAGNQLHLRAGTGKIQIFTAKEKRRTGRPDMYLLGTALIQELCRLPKLCAPHDGIVNQKQRAILDQIIPHTGNIL